MHNVINPHLAVSDRIEEGCLPDAIRVVHRGTFRGALILIVVLLPCFNVL